MSDLVEVLGHRPGSHLLIISGANLGQAHAANVAVYEALRVGVATSASLMVPCAWARDAAARWDGDDVGVQLTLNAELEHYRWGPITLSPSLLDGDGGFPRTVDDLWDHADLDEVRRECRSQIERAALWGLDVTHVTSHLGTLVRRPEFFDVLVDLAVEFSLPVSLPADTDERSIGFPVRQLLAEAGVLTPDHVVEVRGTAGRTVLGHALEELRPGVTQITIRPALDAPEIRGLDPDWSHRVEDYLLGAHDPDIRTMLARAQVTPIGFRELRDAQRRLGGGPRT